MTVSDEVSSPSPAPPRALDTLMFRRASQNESERAVLGFAEPSLTIAFSDDEALECYRQQRRISGGRYQHWVLVTEEDVMVTFLSTIRQPLFTKRGNEPVQEDFGYVVSDAWTAPEYRGRGYFVEALQRLQHVLIEPSLLPPAPSRFGSPRIELDAAELADLPYGRVLSAAPERSCTKLAAKNSHLSSLGLNPQPELNSSVEWRLQDSPIGNKPEEATLSWAFVKQADLVDVGNTLSEATIAELSQASPKEGLTLITPDPNDLAFRGEFMGYNGDIPRGIRFFSRDGSSEGNPPLEAKDPLILFTINQYVTQITLMRNITAPNLEEVLDVLTEHSPAKKCEDSWIEAWHVTDSALREKWEEFGAITFDRTTQEREPKFSFIFRGEEGEVGEWIDAQRWCAYP